MSAYMKQALELAYCGRGRTSPNPAVGAVLVRDGEIVGRGFHTWAGKDHAEIVALREAGAKARDATIYVTLEPCSHTGRTGPCAEALIAAGVKRVEAAMQDPNPLVAGKGLEMLQQAGLEVLVDAEYTAAAEKLNEPFAHFMRTGKPLVTIKAALTLDGKIAAPQDNFGWITSEVARADVQLVRHYSDAILTGLGTVLEDDCLLTDRSGMERSRPLLRIVLDSQLRVPLTAKIITSAQNDVLVVGTSVVQARAAESFGGGWHPGIDGRWTGWADRPEESDRVSGRAALSFTYGGGGEPCELDNARFADCGQDFLLLRSEDLRRDEKYSGRGRNGQAAAGGRDHAGTADRASGFNRRVRSRGLC